MSSQTVKGETLQFTNDNLHCYAYSGNIPLNNEQKTFLSFKSPNNSYIDANFFITGNIAFIGSSKWIKFDLDFDGLAIMSASHIAASAQGFNDIDGYKVIIPPATEVILKIQTNDTGSLDYQAVLTGKVGMPQRVGNLDD